ncbi:MAG TPA: hypothetical protein VK668_24560 [Mucilaginibacter sp.]|nr:hypothetical protein [Mucilaginibacter sp.]
MDALELKAEIVRLEALAPIQETELKKRVSSPKAIFGLFFPKTMKQDYLQLASRILLPLALNNTINCQSTWKTST